MVSPVLYRLDVADEGYRRRRSHCVLSIPSGMAGAPSGNTTPYYNIAMFDVSGSMRDVWPYVMTHWNTEVSRHVNGTVHIYTFSAAVKFRRNGTQLTQDDFDNSSTDLASAITTINNCVQQCRETNVRVFLVTDGHQSGARGDPAYAISQMRVPYCKTVEVYLLGVGDSFPVQYSKDIRSRLHNGSAGCPTLFWARQNHEVQREMGHIREEMLKGMSRVHVSVPGKVLPLVQDTKSEAYNGEFLYYERDPAEIMRSLVITAGDGARMPIQGLIQMASANFLVSNLFKQWNAVLVQRHSNRDEIPMGVFDLMRHIFELQLNQLEPMNSSLRFRLDRKSERGLKLEFSSMLSSTYGIISGDSRFQNEIQLAEAILKSTVQNRPHESKELETRNHGDAEWSRDIQTFKDLYLSIESQVKALPQPDPEDCCRILMCSFVGDLKDPDFLELLKENKTDFLKTMSFTGVPVFASHGYSRDNSPWTLNIKNICGNPYEVLAQRALQPTLDIPMDTSDDFELNLLQDNPNSACNAVVPVIPAQHCQLLQRLVRSNVFSVGVTHCILRNSSIIDHSCHLAALGVVWFKTITDHPDQSTRDHFITKRLADIEATARIYLDEPDIVKYLSVLTTAPAVALMTKGEHQGDVVTCESLVKPLFLIYLTRDKMPGLNIDLFKLLLLEFVGRCLASYTSSSPHMDFFAPHLTDEKRLSFLASVTDRVLATLDLDAA
ncbi:uncharacterized protein LOC108677337 [Hyalella azteca]|uniref:Uncharacterized protein LOC108677337 n=1 Tax=Hyalella azteca TaxID=294128 RepID=A0A8B7P4R8_HYAAZ|nr:uncharacterized protein LOC108677337 [Hyalella azteca]